MLHTFVYAIRYQPVESSLSGRKVARSVCIYPWSVVSPVN